MSGSAMNYTPRMGYRFGPPVQMPMYQAPSFQMPPLPQRTPYSGLPPVSPQSQIDALLAQLQTKNQAPQFYSFYDT